MVSEQLVKLLGLCSSSFIMNNDNNYDNWGSILSIKSLVTDCNSKMGLMMMLEGWYCGSFCVGSSKTLWSPLEMLTLQICGASLSCANSGKTSCNLVSCVYQCITFVSRLETQETHNSTSWTLTRSTMVTAVEWHSKNQFLSTWMNWGFKSVATILYACSRFIINE